jgi:hypothetical protein
MSYPSGSSVKAVDNRTRLPQNQPSEGGEVLVENDWRDSRCIVTPLGKSRSFVIRYMVGQAHIIR